MQDAISLSIKQLHGTYRRLLRERISAHSAAREHNFKDRKLAKYIRSVLECNTHGGLPTEVLTKDKTTGVPILITDPSEIRTSWKENFDTWMGRHRERYYIHDTASSKVDHPTLADTPVGREKRKEIQYSEGKIDCAKYELPPQYLDVIKCSRVKISNKNRQMKPSDYGNIRKQTITHGTWDNYIRMKKKMVAPGKSGVQYAHLAAMSKEMRHLMCDISNLTIISGYIFKAWKTELIYTVPKEPGNPDQSKQRPIKLQEALRKVTIGIKKNEILDVWREHVNMD